MDGASRLTLQGVECAHPVDRIARADEGSVPERAEPLGTALLAGELARYSMLLEP